MVFVPVGYALLALGGALVAATGGGAIASAGAAVEFAGRRRYEEGEGVFSEHLNILIGPRAEGVGKSIFFLTQVNLPKAIQIELPGRKLVLVQRELDELTGIVEAAVAGVRQFLEISANMEIVQRESTLTQEEKEELLHNMAAVMGDSMMPIVVARKHLNKLKRAGCFQ